MAQYFGTSTSDMSFKSIPIPFQVNTTTGDPVDLFFNPLLRLAKTYDVAVGYFSTAWIRDAANGIASLAVKGGRSRWVISPALSKQDWDLLSSCSSESERSEVIASAAIANVRELQRALEDETRVALAWLIRDGVVNLKIAVPKNKLSGIFHAKIGVFTDSENNKVAFSGSYNLTGAAGTNWETLDIFLGWNFDDSKRVQAREEQFESVWGGKDPNLSIYEPTDAVVAQFIEITEHTRRPYQLPGKVGERGDSSPWIPKYLLDANGKLRSHQEAGIEAWFKANGRGIFQMATGSGKTVAALAVATKLSALARSKKSQLVIIVAVPYKHLAEQWQREAAAFGFDPLICYESFEAWAPHLHRKLTGLRLGTEDFAFFITANATFCSERFQSLLTGVESPLLFVADEMHNMGGERIRTMLPANAAFRLGLSATPDRHNDDEGTAVIRDYFGDTVANYGLAQAIKDGTLTRYFYHPILVEFSADEMDEYVDLSARIARQMARGAGDNDDSNDALKFLLIERSRLIGSAEGKIPALKSLLMERRDSMFNLIYCGDVISDGERSVDAVLNMVGNTLGMRANRFTSSESNLERRDILGRFGSGEIQALVAIRCLDEGVDVPRTETAYILASSLNPRQFIQRRGRVLRRAPGKEYAHIYDFIVVPPVGATLNDAAFNSERTLMRRELSRVDEFASSSENAGDALRALRAIKIRLNLLDS